jgi:helix-hairpin-helix protein
MDGHDELSEVTGIGPARARWLGTAFGVRSLRDLAALSPEDIERMLKAEGRVAVSRKTIESWVAEARERAAEESGEPAPPAARKGADREDEAAEWKPVASFVVEFQSRPDKSPNEPWRTMVHYLEEDRNETWAGVDCEGLCRWMTQQLGRAERGGVPAPSAAVRPGETTAGEDATAARGSGGLGVPPWRPRLADGLRARVVDGDGVEGARLIRIDKPWAVVFSWSLEDPVPAEAGGGWRLDVLLKRVGPGEPVHVPVGPVRLPAAEPRIDGGYRYRFAVATGVITSSRVEASYRAAATIMSRQKGEERVLHAGFVDLGLLRFYEPAAASTGEPSPIASIQRS